MLEVTEIYKSLQGEAGFAGFPCIFIRLTGCPLRCRWCDTVYGFKGGKSLSVEEILQQVGDLGINLVELTGGEPLAQEECIPLMKKLIESGYRVLIETSGAEPIENIPEDVHIIMDIKCPGSKMDAKNRLENIAFLKKTDEIKFVVASREDFDWAIDLIKARKLDEVCQVLFSAAFGLVRLDDLSAWILDSKVPSLRLNMQLHKYIWDPKKKGV